MEKKRVSSYKELFINGLDITDLWIREKEQLNHIKTIEIIQKQFQYGIFYLDLNGYLIKCDNQVQSIFDKKEEELLGLSFLTFIHPEDVNDFYFDFLECLEKKVKFSKEVRIKDSSLNYYWYSFIVYPEKLNLDQKSVYLCSVMNVHSYKSLEKELVTQSERYRIGLKSLKVGLWEYDLKNNIFVSDTSFSKFFDISFHNNDKTLDDFLSIIHLDDRNVFIQQFQNALSSSEYFETKFRFTRMSDEKILQFSMTGIVLKKDNQVIDKFTGLLWDTTSEWELENKKINNIKTNEKASKLQALVEMSSQIAHEINNPLAIVLGKSQFLNKLIKLNKLTQENLIKDLEVIEVNGKRIAEFVKELRKIKSN